MCVRLHFDLVTSAAGTVPAVATELRLITELVRAHENRFRPIIEHLRSEGCDLNLIRRGLVNAGISHDGIDRVIAVLRSDRNE